MGRTREEVQEHITALLRDYIRDNNPEESMAEDVATARIVRNSINMGKMLYKDEAKWLEKLIEDRVRAEMEHALEYSMNITLAVDELSIYSDAWGFWCRPGTYMIMV